MPFAMTDAIPLVQSDGFTGRNNARDFRTQLLAGLFLPDSVGYGVRPGVIPRRYITGFDFVDLRPIQLGSPGSAVQFYPGKCIVSRTGQGPYLLSQETTVANYPLDNADPTNPRIDLLFARLYDHSIGDSGGGPHGPYIDHITGNPAGVPVAPSAPPDALPIAQVLRPANDSLITNARITDLRKSTAPLGTPRIMLAGDSLGDAGIFVGERRIRMASATQIAAGVAPYLEDIWCADGKWRPTQQTIIARNKRSTNVSTTATSSGTAFRIMNTGGLVFGGRTYEIWGRGALRNTVAGVTAQLDFRYTTDGSEPTVANTQLAREIADLADANVPETLTWSFNYDAPADQTFRVVVAMFVAAGGGTLTYDAAAGPSPGELVIEDKGTTVPLSGNIY